MNYQKSILVFITVMLLNITAIADGLATYLPLTTPTNDGAWILFGVNGFSDGRASSRSAVAAGFSTDYVELNDTDPQDAFATWGISASGAAQPAFDNLVSVQGIDDLNLTTLKVAAEVLQPFVASEPIRSMYIRVNSTTPNVKIDYKSSMEGQNLEIFVGDDSPLYSVNLSQHNTYSNSAQAIVSVRVAASVTKLSNITDVIDYQFGDNPLDAKYFSKTEHQDNSESLSIPVKTATFYHFDSISQQWKVWDSRFFGVANDFTAFSKGDAYWGRIDVDDNPIVNDGSVGSGITDSSGNNILGSGLVLGKSGEPVPNPDAYKYDDNSSKLRAGWNMLSFDEVRPYIRRASTGLVVTSLESAGDIILTDSTGVNSIQITLTAVPVNLQATEINRAIEIAKVKGRVPKSFNIKAFSSDTIANPKRIILISDAKFTLEDESGADNITIVETLTGNNPYNEFGVQTQKYTNLDTNTSGQQIARSAYGEYSVIVDIMTDDLRTDDTAATLDSAGAGSGDYVSAKLVFGTVDRDYTPISFNSVNDTQPNASTVKIEIEAHPLFDKTIFPIDSYGKAIELDSLNDGSEDKMIISSTTPFYIKDSTYIRVFDYNETTGNNARKFEVVGSRNLTVKPTVLQTVLGVASYVNDNADTNEDSTGVYAGIDGTKLVFVSTTLSTFDVKDLEDGDYEFLISTTSDADIAKGAVAGVYALDTIAKMPLIQHSFSFDNIEVPDDADDNITIQIDGGTGSVTTAGATFLLDTTDTTERLSYFDRIVATINADIVTDDIHAYAFHDYTSAVDDFNGTKITIEGFDAHDITFTMANGGGVAELAPLNLTDAYAATVATLGASWTAMTSDLKSNAIYAPNYVARGPLYTIREAGFDVQAMLKATTDVTDLSIGWDSIDITRDESDWFKNNEFNLFNINSNSGYWVYLVSKEADSVAISSPNYKATYTYYFDNIDSNGEYITRNIINGGQFSVQIEGVNNQISTAYVSINGEEVQLKRSGISDEFTADFTKYALKAFNEELTGPISMTIRATNGKGEAASEYDAYTLDYTAPVLDVPTAPDEHNISFSADGNVTTFYVYNEYIPELYSSRVDADPEINRLVGSYDANSSGEVIAELCKELPFGEVDNLRVIAVDGIGEIGFSNISNAQQFKYATMLKSAHVLKDVGGDLNETSIGERYDSTCELLATQPTLATDNNGVSVKSVHDNNETRLVYEVIDGVTLSTSVPWTTAYSIGGVAVIHTKSLVEYKSKPFFLQYNSKIYVSAFPATSDAASASLDSNATAILLDDVTEFLLDGDGNSIGGSGNEISILNDTLLLP